MFTLAKILRLMPPGCVMFMTLPSWSAEETANQSSQQSVAANAESLDLPVGTSELIGLGGSLLLVIGAVVIVGWIYSRTQGLRGAASDVISIVAAQALGPKERIVLVEVGGKQMVLGMTTQQVQTLHVFDEPIVTAEEPVAVSSAFATRLRSAIRGVGR